MMGQRIAIVFGGTGFLGHAVVQALTARGYQVRIPTRDLSKAEDMRLMGAVGQVVPLRASMRSDAAVLDLMQGASVVVNLLGSLVETKKDPFQLVHVELAARLARHAKSAGVRQFVHVSALGADMKSASRYAHTKAIGEEAVRAFFPDAVIMRPSLMFGPRDSFFNKFALMARYLPFLPLIGGGHTKFQPIYVGDVAAAIMAALERSETKGRLFALGGPDIYTFRELMALMLRIMGLRRWLVNVPWGLARVKARLFELFPNPPLTRDQIELLKEDNVVPERGRSGMAGRAPCGTLADLGVKATELEGILPLYVPRFKQRINKSK